MDPSEANSSSWEHQQQAIDAEIKSLEESIRALKHRRNALAPISSLPTEVIAVIFSYLRLPSTSPFSSLPTKLTTDLFSSLPLPGTPPLGRRPDHHPWDWLGAAHVCHRWREIALNDPVFWSHVDFANLTAAGAAEILARAKTMPLHLEARDARPFSGDDARLRAFEKGLQAHVSTTCHLSITAQPHNLRRTFDGLASPAPTLEYLSLSQVPSAWGYIPSQAPVRVPDTLFDGTTPRLSCLELHNCTISWKSPLMKGLKYLEIRKPDPYARPSLTVWLDALDEMPQLMRLVLHSASPNAPPFPFNIERAVTLPSLAYLDISASARDCALALAHLTIPALARLCLAVESHYSSGDDVQNMFPYVARHANGPQDTQPLQSALIHHKKSHTTILAWPVPDMNIEVHDPFAFLSAEPSARVALFIASQELAYFTYPRNQQHILDAAMNALPLDNLVTLTAQYPTRLDARFWLRHVPKWPLLQRLRLAPPLACGFREMLLQDNGSCEYPLLPSLIELALIDVALGEHRTRRLCDALMKRVEQGVPLETLDLRTCQATSHAVRLLSEIVVDVREPFVMYPVPWEPVPCGSFVLDDSSEAEVHLENDDEMVQLTKAQRKKLKMRKRKGLMSQ